MSEPDEYPRGPSGHRAGRFTPRRASERRKLVRLADELGDARQKYEDRLGRDDSFALLDASAVLERLAEGMDRERDAPEGG